MEITTETPGNLGYARNNLKHVTGLNRLVGPRKFVPFSCFNIEYRKFKVFLARFGLLSETEAMFFFRQNIISCTLVEVILLLYHITLNNYYAGEIFKAVSFHFCKKNDIFYYYLIGNTSDRISFTD